MKDKERLVYINPLLNESYSPTINLFEITDKSEQNISKVAQIILGVFKSIKIDDTFSGQMEDLLLNCIRVLLRKGGGSFSELYRFMNDKRNDDLVSYAKNSSNPLEEEYFNDYFSGETNTKNAVRRRLSTILGDPLFMNLMNGTNSLNLEKEMNTKGNIIILDVPKGEMNETYEYYIRFILEYILGLVLNRVKIRKEDRVLTHLFLDEFHNFVSLNNNIKTILTEVGKYNFFLTMAHQAISQIPYADLKDILLSMTERKIIGKNSNKTLEAMNKTLNMKLEDVEKLDKGEFYISVANNDIVKIKNTDRFLDSSEEISNEQWEEHKQYQLAKYYRPIKQNIASQPTEEEINEMIKQFKADLISKNLTETSCLYKLKTSAPERFKEIKNDFEFRTPKDNECKPRIRQQEISTIFQLAFELNELISNRKFISQLKNENVADKFNQIYSGTRSSEFTDNGKSNTENYYYL
ncbi:hypothetical protein CRU87_09155 [Aliarcobacter trophiarum LMG 25534]|uniref:TraD/TraG TraM recognition site domain-containing protein n=1 Tax=Aliarcobacter trophiarum LMG 25534 TaxID=1032241 RepID=A0ABY0EUZ4_9BACT|nr:type IV secretory system conjugative DNA transfer family protein [Aliarcobacter trophiarum]RXJ89385.1 hypothetical protein CRU87_09155 [Aliarcobacter trophiarum LMG 25534]